MIPSYWVEEKTIQEMVRVIVKEIDPVRIILFGSRSRQDYRPDSDIDLLVVVRAPFDENHNRRKEAVRLWRALAPFRVPKDILVFTQDEVDQWSRSLNHIVAHATREGKTLYETV